MLSAIITKTGFSITLHNSSKALFMANMAFEIHPPDPLPLLKEGGIRRRKACAALFFSPFSKGGLRGI
jgi:hypothetical protein